VLSTTSLELFSRWLSTNQVDASFAVVNENKLFTTFDAQRCSLMNPILYCPLPRSRYILVKPKTKDRADELLSSDMHLHSLLREESLTLTLFRASGLTTHKFTLHENTDSATHMESVTSDHDSSSRRHASKLRHTLQNVKASLPQPGTLRTTHYVILFGKS
jgi:hypothetical protein